MSAENARVEMVLVSRDEASAAVRAVAEAMKGLERQAKALGAVLGGGIGAELGRRFDELTTRARAFSTVMSDTAERGAKSLNGETAAARELAAALRDVASAQDAVARGARAGAGGNRPPRGPSGAGNAGGRPGRNGGAGNDLRDVRARWRIREASQRAEHQAAERERRATVSAAAAQVRAQHDAFAQRLRDARYLIGVRERSEANEMRHAAGLRRERDAMRHRAASAGWHACGHLRHAVNSVNHPVLQSPGFWLHAGAVFGIEAGKHMLDVARSIDAATTRYKMMPGVSTADAAAVRANALREGMRIGLDPAEVVRLQLQGIKDGLSKDIAASLPAIVNAAVQTMGGDLNRDGDELAKAVREAGTVGWVKDAAGARSLMNSVAGLSTFNGNSPEKMQQFLAFGGIGRGKELGWTKDQTLAFGAALNGSGERTGLGSARLMAQIPEIRAQMRDRFIKATRSHENSEENRAARAAPRMMGYGGISDMQQAFATPEGVTDFLSRMSKLPEQTRAAIEKAYGLGPQFNAVAAEMGADHGARYKQAFKREQQLSSQNAVNDELSKNSKIWSGSIDFMVGQLKASVEAIQSELGDVIKDDILTPFTKWWVKISESLLNGGMKAEFHRAITGFVEGLGFSDVTAALNSLRASVGTFDFAGFMRGVGEGARAFLDEVRSLASVFGGAGGLDAQTVGRLAAELFGLSVALHVMAPVLTAIGGFVSGVLAVKAVIEGVAWVSRPTGISAALQAILGVDLAAGAAGLMSFAGALGVIGAAVQGLISLGVLNKIEVPHDMKAESWDRFMWGRNPDGTSARPAWVDRLTGGGAKPGEGFTTGPHGGLVPQPQAYQGGGSNWRDLLQPAAYVTDGNEDATTGDRDRMTAAAIGTQRAVQKLADLFEARGTAAGLSTIGGASGAGTGEGGGGSSAMSSANRLMHWAGHAAGDNLGSSSTPARGALAANQKEAFAAARAAGLNETAARALVANMSGESLAQPGNYHWDRKHMSGGIVQWDPQRAAAIKAQFGKLPWQMSVAEQTKAAVWEIQNNPRFAATARALKGDDSGAMIGALVRNYESPANPGAAIMRRMGYYRGFNPNAAAGGGAGEAAGNLHLATRVLGEQCVDLAKAAVGATGSVTTWRKGVGADVGSLVPGTPVATFLDRQGRETSRYAGGGTGTPGAHLDYAGIFRKYVLDGAGKRIGMEIAEQFKGSSGVHLKRYMFGQGYGEGNGSNYHAILGPDGKPLGGNRNPLAKLPTPAGLAEGAKGLPKGSTPAPHHAPAPHNVTADNSQVVHITNHFNGHHDPHKVASTLKAQFATDRRSSYVDIGLS